MQRVRALRRHLGEQGLVATAAAMTVAALALWGCCGTGPGRLEPRLAAEYGQRAAALEAEYPGTTAVVAPPFVVIGDGRADEVQAYAHQVVGWATRLLKKDFFPKDPGKILAIWVFHNDVSYRYRGTALFGAHPSPYGYYAPCDDAIIVNAGLGAGTLVHEMVHAFMEANFPDAPTWFDEGLASQYEQPEERDGRIRGRTNWRLAPLQQKIQTRRIPRLEDLLSMSPSEFRDEDAVGTHYAMARYLCYYLQERDLLVSFYHRFAGRHDDDPSGIETLKEVLSEGDLDALQGRWERFVSELSYP